MKRSVPTIIIDEQTLFREGLAVLLHDTCYKVVASIASVSELSDLKLPSGRALLILLGLGSGKDLTPHSVQKVRQTINVDKLIGVVERQHGRDFQKILDSGADGIVFDVGSSDALLKALALALVGQQVIILGRPLESETLREDASPRAVGNAPDGPIARSEMADESETKRPDATLAAGLRGRLSEREQQILTCVTRGESNKTIARSCSITEATVKVHLQSILRKISARNRTQAALWAVENQRVLSTSHADGAAVLASNGANGIAVKLVVS